MALEKLRSIHQPKGFGDDLGLDGFEPSGGQTLLPTPPKTTPDIPKGFGDDLGLDGFEPSGGRTLSPKTNKLDDFYRQTFSTAGLGKVPFSPLSSLGINLYNGEENNSNSDINQSWQSLYLTNQKNKDNPSWGGLSPISYNANVNRDKLNIRSFSPNQPFFRNAIAGIVPEPYIVSNIPKSSSDISSGRVINFGGRDLPIARLVTDALRVGSFLSSPAGIAFGLKQNFLGANSMVQYMGIDGELYQSKQRFKSAYNPLSTLIQTGLRAGGFPLALTDRTEPDLSSIDGLMPGVDLSFLNSTEYGRVGDTVSNDINRTFTDGDAIDPGSNGNQIGFGDKLKEFGNKLKSNLTGAASKITPTNYGDLFTQIPFSDNINNKTLQDAYGEDGANKIESAKNGMPFYFKDMRTNAYILFRAYLEGISENISPSYTPHNYIGRSEPVYVYERAEREINFTLKLVAQNSGELNAIYKKMDRLTSLCYPQYENDDYGNRMKPPLTKLRLGEMFGTRDNELMGYIKSLSYSVEQSSTWESQPGRRVPRHITATIGYQVIHANVPNLETKFYGINY